VAARFLLGIEISKSAGSQHAQWPRRLLGRRDLDVDCDQVDAALKDRRWLLPTRRGEQEARKGD
jgi:hypothetical protein